MRALSALELLSVWETGQGKPPVQRASLLLKAACDDTPTEAIERWPIGRRDEHLLTLREWAFGPTLHSVAPCPACGQTLELELPISDIRVTPPSADVDVFSVSACGHDVRFRLANFGDLLDLSPAHGPESNRTRLLERCVISARTAGSDISVGLLPAEVLFAVEKRMSEADPQADVQFELTCPECGHQWTSALDIASFFWGEINAWANRILREVHTLASAYGWTEAEILSLSPMRRQAYLEMVGV